MQFIYIHGFNSSFDFTSQKLLDLSMLFHVHGVNYDSFASHREILVQLIEGIPPDIEMCEVVFAGTSLGGYWAAEMGKRFCRPSVIINPCLFPHIVLQKHVGIELMNYQTGEKKTLTEDAIRSYSECSKHNGPTNITNKDAFSYLPLVLLDMGDDVINSYETQRLLSEYPMTCFEGGSHRFNHMKKALPYIKEYINHCSYVDQLGL